MANTPTVVALKMKAKGELQNAYSPLQNLVNKSSNSIGDFTTPELNFDPYTPVDIIVTDEYDGSTNLIINDDKNNPKLINSRFSVQENNTFNIPTHNGIKVTNVYEEETFNQDVQLLKLYNTIPDFKFKGIYDGGQIKCGSYVFYFKFVDADGNMTNIVQESGIIQVHIGNINQAKIRMGLEDENSGKLVKLMLSSIDAGFDYVRIFYERTSTNQSQAAVPSFFMINHNFPIKKGICDITLTGAEEVVQITRSDIQTEFADIATAKTQVLSKNTLFLGNISAYEQNYSELQKIAWKIIPTVRTINDNSLGIVNTQKYQFQHNHLYYNMQNVHDKVGYWPDELYRFGIVFIYNNNLLSPVFNLQGVDFDALYEHLKKNDTEIIDNESAYDISHKLDYATQFFNLQNEEWSMEPEELFFRKNIKTNPKGVIKLPSKVKKPIVQNPGKTLIQANPLCLDFDFTYIGCKKSDELSQNEQNYPSPADVLRKLNIKGFFIVRQKRIPTIIAQGMVVGLTGRYNGCLPVLQNTDGQYITKSFLSPGRSLLDKGSTVAIKATNVSNKALLVPDFDVSEPIFNQIFTGAEFQLSRAYTTSNKIVLDHHFTSDIKPVDTGSIKVQNDVMLTSVPKNTHLITDGTNYFSTIAGVAEEAYKTEDVNNRWSRTKPQDLTVSTSVVRGKWGSYVGMSTDEFDYGDIVNIKSNDWKDPNHLELEFEKRFKDYSLYSAVTPRMNIDVLSKNSTVRAFRGDCFINLFTHRMMSNFIDPELPTNKKIIDPSCWHRNYAVRCTAEIIKTTHSNLTADSDGWYIPSPQQNKSGIASLILGILSGQIGLIVKAATQMKAYHDQEEEPDSDQDQYANEIATAFEVYIGKDGQDKRPTDADVPMTDDSTVAQKYTYKDVIQNGWIKKLDPKEQEQQGGFNLKAIFKADDKWELHGLASINRADVNAVKFGQWITFPICSPYNLALRDVDFSQATEEASFNRKRSFYPLEAMDVSNNLFESGIINGAAKISISNNQRPAYRQVPYIKQEFFNRIYWSKPNVSEAFINSYRMIFNDQYREYNKEWGAITKLIDLGDTLMVVFQHGIGVLPINRSSQSEADLSPYLASRNVLPAQVQTLTGDYGSMWKDSIIQTPQGTVYGVDTVAKKIWKYSSQGFEFISDHKVSKFLNDWIDLSEYDFNEYQGHINVKTHYNEFKHDVMFTYYKDTPMTWHKYEKNGSGEYEIVEVKDENDEPVWSEVDLSSNLILEDTLDQKPLIDVWKPGKTWNLCYNEVLGKFVTFYDWYPLESTNVDNIYFSFDREQMDHVLNQTNEDDSKFKAPDDLLVTYNTPGLITYNQSKKFLDRMFTNNTKVYKYTNSTNKSISFTKPTTTDEVYLSCYYKPGKSGYLLSDTFGQNWTYEKFGLEVQGKDSGWLFCCTKDPQAFNIVMQQGDQFAEVHFTVIKSDINGVKQITLNDEILRYQELRNIDGPRMYLWKHGHAGLYDNQGKIKPTFWYGKQHEFNIEFVVNQDAHIQKIFNNLKIISNKTAPNKFEYEVVGEGYDWYDLKPVIQWINDHATDQSSFEYYYKEVLSLTYDQLRNKYLDFPEIFYYEENPYKVIPKIPFLHIETADKHGRQDKSYHKDTDYWDDIRKTYVKGKDRYSFNTSETIIVEDEQLNEQRVHTESLGNDMKKYGRVRGNMQYLEDLWDIEIRPISFQWAYMQDGELKFKKSVESRHRDKYIKIRIRYTGEDLVVLQQIVTMFDYSFS